MLIKKKPMSIFQKVFYLISFIFLLGSFIYLGTKDFSIPKKKLTDQEAFAEEYHITTSNIYNYHTSKEILEQIEDGSAVIFMAYPENKWSLFYADLLNQIAKECGLKEIYYYNFKNDRSNNNHYYESIVKKLHSYLPNNDYQNINIYAPTLIIVKNGQIIYFDDETSIVRGNEEVDLYWTAEKIAKKKNEISSYIYAYLGETNE